MTFYISTILNFVFSLDPADHSILLQTPITGRNTFDGNLDHWEPVDFMLLMDEEFSTKNEVEYAYKFLSSIQCDIEALV